MFSSMEYLLNRSSETLKYMYSNNCHIAKIYLAILAVLTNNQAVVLFVCRRKYMDIADEAV